MDLKAKGKKKSKSKISKRRSKQSKSGGNLSRPRLSQTFLEGKGRVIMQQMEKEIKRSQKELKVSNKSKRDEKKENHNATDLQIEVVSFGKSNLWCHTDRGTNWIDINGRHQLYCDFENIKPLSHRHAKR